MDCIKSVISELRTSPMARIQYMWYLSLALSFSIMIAGVIVADEMPMQFL